MKKMGLFWFAAALLGAALIFSGCETEAETETVTVTKGMAADVDALQALLDMDGVNYVEFVGNLLAIGSTDTLVIPAGKTVKVNGNVTVASSGGNKGLLAVGGTLTLTGTITNDGIVIGSDDFIKAVGGETYGIVASLPATDAEFEALGKSVTAVENLTLKKGTPLPAWYDYDLTVYVYGTLTVEGDATAPASDADVVAIGNVLIDGSEATVATLNAAKIDVSNATITLNENKTVTVTLPSPLTGPTFKVTAEQGVLKVTGPTVINNVRVTNNNGFVEFISNVTEANISGDGRVRFSGAAAFAGATASNIEASLVEFTNATTPTFAVANSSITAEKITFTKGLTLSAALALNGGVYIGTETLITFSEDDGPLTLGAGSTVNVGTAQLLSADSEVVLTAATDGAILTATAAVTTSGSEAPANLALSAQPLTLTSGTLTVATGSAFDLAKALTIAAGAELVANGTVNVAITDGSLVLTGAASTGAKISGAGGVKAGATTITGIWQAVETSASATVKIEAASAVASSITASATTVTFTAGTGGTITQGVGTSNNLTIGANTTIDLGASAGSIVLKGITTTANNGKITLAATTATITANSGSTNATLAISGADVGTSITGKKESSSSTKLAVLAGATSNNTIASDSASDFTISGALAIE